MQLDLKIPILRALFVSLPFFICGVCAAENLEKSHEKVVKNAALAVEQTGVKVGMKKDDVMKLLGEKFTEEKISLLQPDEKVLTWQKDKDSSVTVTFVGEKVKAVAHKLIKPEDESDED